MREFFLLVFAMTFFYGLVAMFRPLKQVKTNQQAIGTMAVSAVAMFLMTGPRIGYFVEVQNTSNVRIEIAAQAACIRFIKESALHPSTVYIGGSGFRSDVRPDGSATITQPFSPKNPFGLDLEFHAHCEVGADGNVSGRIVEVLRVGNH